MTTGKNNKLIAEFMGLEANEQKIIILYQYLWDWLMPVVEKIDDMFGEDDNIDNGINRVHNAVLTFDINQVYGHVVDFINEYNKNK